jgi:hypothetical protein
LLIALRQNLAKYPSFHQLSIRRIIENFPQSRILCPENDEENQTADEHNYTEDNIAPLKHKELLGIRPSLQIRITVPTLTVALIGARYRALSPQGPHVYPDTVSRRDELEHEAKNSEHHKPNLECGNSVFMARKTR